MKRATSFIVCALLIWGVTIGIAYAQSTMDGNFMGNPAETVGPALVTQNEYSVNYEHPASAGYSSRPLGSAQSFRSGPLAARSVQRNPVAGPDPGMTPPRRISKCKPDQAGACGPKPYAAPYAGIPCGPPPLPCGPVCIPDQINWY